MARDMPRCDNRAMPRRKTKKGRAQSPPAVAAFANRPFHTLPHPHAAAPAGGSSAAPRASAHGPGRPPARGIAPAAVAEPGGEELFAAAMRDVRPLDERQRAVVPPARRPPRRRPIEDPDAEVLAALSDLVSGEGAFDITDTTEFVEAAVAGVDRRLVRRLRRGDFAFRRHLDLHGMTVDGARSAVAEFLQAALRDGERCVLIVHGRGLNSRDRVPVLKRHLVAWLSRGAWARVVLAFSSARPCDGGAGALYVLLRRKRNRKKEVEVTEGGKW